MNEAEQAKFALVNDETVEQMIQRLVSEEVEKQLALNGIQQQMYNIVNNHTHTTQNGPTSPAIPDPR